MPYYHVVFTPADRHRPHRLSEQARALWHPLQGRLRDIADHSIGPQASGRQDRRDGRAPQLGLGASPIIPMSTASFRAAASHLTGSSWVACRPGFFLPVRVPLAPVPALVSGKADGYAQGRRTRLLQRQWPALADPNSFADLLAPLRKTDWAVYAKKPFAGPEAVLAYLSRYTHRIAISNSRLIAFDGRSVTFKLEGLPRQRQGALQDHDPGGPMNSSDASSFTSCPRASIASGTLDSLPMALGPKT